jgi:hypothetical protein
MCILGPRGSSLVAFVALVFALIGCGSGPIGAA